MSSAGSKHQGVSRLTRRGVVVAYIVMVLLGAGISSAVASPVIGVVVTGAGLAASLAAFVLLGHYAERHFFQDRNSPVNTEFRGVGGVWPYGGGAVSVGFPNPEDGPVLPTVQDDDPHRTTPPRWLTDLS